MTQRQPFFRSLLTVIAMATSSLLAQQVITIEERIEMTGTIKSVSPGIVIVTNQDGEDVEFKIQEPGKPGVSLAGASIVLDFPAQVEIGGTLQSDALKAGLLVRFSAGVNRLGRTQGKIEQITTFDEGEYKLGLEVTQAADKPAEYSTCLVTAEVFSRSDNRLVVTIPQTDFVRNNRLAFEISEDLQITLESGNYRRARRGDQVTQLLGARFSTGDRAIQQLKIEVAGGVVSRKGDDDSLRSKYRGLSDAPAQPRDLRSAHYLLHTDISDRSARILLDKLETMIALVSQYYGRPPGGVTECYVVRDLQQWPPGSLPAPAIAKISEPAGVTLSASLGRVTKSVVYSCDKHGVVQHEAIHAYCAQTFGSTGPTWYSEGMAEMGQYWKPDQREVNVDPVVIDYLKNAEAKKMLDIVAAGQITGDSWRAYAWRWALCHLLASNPNYAGRFKALGMAMMSEQPGATFESVYGPVAREISFEYDFFTRHLDNGYRSDLCAWQWNRKFQYLRGSGHVSVNVIADYGWQASNFRLRAGESYDFATKGSWTLTADGDAIDADGQTDGKGRLVGVLMKDFELGQPFALGTRGSFTAPDDADLYLRCRDDWNRVADNDGTMTVHLRIKPDS